MSKKIRLPLESNRLCKYGLDSKAIKLFMDGKTELEVWQIINSGLPDGKTVPFGDICQFGNELKIQWRKDKHGR